MKPNSCNVPKQLFIFLLLFISTPSLTSQNETKKYDFIKQEFNRLYFSKDSSTFHVFCSKLNQIKKRTQKKISIVHIGGSHVQGGTWSNSFINAFQNEFGTQGGGYFAFPYKVAKTNGQPYVRSFSSGKWKRCRGLGKDYCQPLGPCAMSLINNDSINNFGVTLTDVAKCKTFNEIKIYHSFNNSYALSVKHPFIYKTERRDFEKEGYTLFTFSSPTDSVLFEVQQKDTLQKDFFLFGLSLENTMQPGFYLAALGANGAASSTFLRCSSLSSQLASLAPDMVVISLGVNDTQSKSFEKSEYIEHYDSLIAVIKKANPNTFILLTTTTDNYVKRRSSNKRTLSARDAMFELMEKHNIGVWDLFSLMGGYKSIVKWNKAGLAARDRIHFTPKGYSLLGNFMFEAVMRSYSTNQKASNH